MIYFKKLRWRNFLSTGNQFIEVDLAKSPSTLIIGTNGAGKSSLFKCMTGEISATKGTVYVDGHSITHEQSYARQLIG
jgi:ABC-type multidrug transport system ATPase subunit